MTTEVMKPMTTRELVKLAFPDYRGRKITETIETRPVDVTSYWDGGSRDYFVAIDLRTGRIAPIKQNGTPYDGGPIAPNGVLIPAWGALVRHSIFCGKDCGVTVMRGTVKTIETNNA